MDKIEQFLLNTSFSESLIVPTKIKIHKFKNLTYQQRLNTHILNSMQSRSIVESLQHDSYQYRQGQGLQQQMLNIMDNQGWVDDNRNPQHYQQVRVVSRPDQRVNHPGSQILHVNINDSRQFVQRNISNGSDPRINKHSSMQGVDHRQNYQIQPTSNINFQSTNANMNIQRVNQLQRMAVSQQNTNIIQSGPGHNRVEYQNPQVRVAQYPQQHARQIMSPQPVQNHQPYQEARSSSENKYIVNSQPDGERRGSNIHGISSQPVYQNQPLHQTQLPNTMPVNVMQQQSYSQHNQQRVVSSQPLIVHSQPPSYVVHENQFYGVQPNPNYPLQTNPSDQLQTTNIQRLQKSSKSHRYEQKYIQLFEKFVWYSQRHQYFTREINYLNDQLDNVNNEQEWIELKRRHADALQKFVEIDEQLNIIALQHKDIIQGLIINSEISGQAANISEEWMASYAMLQQEYKRTKQKLQSMQGLQTGYQQLVDHYQRLEAEHQNAINIIGQLQSEINVMKEQANRAVRESADLQSAKRIEELQKYAGDLQQYLKQIQNENLVLQDEVRRFQQNNRRAKSSNSRSNDGSVNQQNQSVSNVNQQEYMRLVHMVQEKDRMISQFKEMNGNRQAYDQIIQEKDNEIQHLKTAMDRIEMQQKQSMYQQIQELEQKIKAAVVSLEKKIKDLEQEVHRKNKEKEQLRANYENQINSLNQELTRKNNQSEKTFRQLQEKIYTLEEQARRKGVEKDHNIRDLNRKIAELEDEITRKNYEVIRPLSDKNMKLQQQINQKIIQLSRYKQGGQFMRHEAQARQLNESIEYKNQEVAMAKKEKERIQKQYDDLHKEFDDIILDYNKKKAELNVLKRQAGQVSSYQAQINSLNEILHKKNQQIFQMKSHLMDSEQVRAELNASFQTVERLNETIKNRNMQISNLKENMFGLEQRLREATQPLVDLKSPKHLQEQIDYLNEGIKRKDQELGKMRQTIQLKDSNIQQLELEKQKLKSKFAMFERVLEEEREEFKKRMANTQIRCESKVKQANEYTNEFRYSTQKQIGNLREQLNGKQNLIYELNGAVEQHKMKLSQVERERNEIRTSHQICIRKLEDKESLIVQLRMKLDGFQQQLSNKQDKMRQFKTLDGSYKDDLKKLQVRLNELQTQIQAKDGIIKSMQAQNKDLNEKQRNIDEQIDRIKASHQQELQKVEQNITLLNHKVASYEHKLMNMNQFSSLDFQVKDFHSNQIFEQKVIYQLKTENQRLRHQIFGLGKTIPPKDTTNKKKTSQKPKKTSSPSKSHKKNKNTQNQEQNTQGINYIQQRLQDFNAKLQELIVQNQENQLQGNVHYRGRQQGLHSNQELTEQIWQKLEQDRQILIEKHSEQISIMRSKVADLQKYTQILEARLRQGQISFAFGGNSQGSPSQTKSNTKITSEEQTVYIQQITYFKQKNKELEERVNQHITVNNELKARLEGMLKAGGNTSSVSYLKDEIHTLQLTVQNLNARIIRLTQENKEIRKQVNIKRTTIVQNSDNRIFQLQNSIQQLSRKVSHLTVENKALQNEKFSILTQFDRVKAQLFQQRNNSNQRVSESTYVAESSIRSFQQKSKQQQIELVRLINKNRILQSENQRLNEMLKNKGNDSSAEVAKLKQRLSDMQQQCRGLQIIIDNKDRDIFKIQSQLTQLSSKVSFYENQVSRLSNIQNFRNQQESSEISRLNVLIREQEKSIKTLNSEISSLKYEYNTLKVSSQSEYSRISENFMHLQLQYNKLFQEFSIMKNEGSNSAGQIQRLRQIMGYIQYSLELLRSNYIEIDAIFGQLKLKDNEQVSLAQNFRINVERGLTICSEVNLAIDS